MATRLNTRRAIRELIIPELHTILNEIDTLRMTSNPYKFFLLLALILSVGIGIALWHFTRIHPLWIYLITITLITFLFYGYDKYQAINQNSRIPEAVLHLLALIGGGLLICRKV